MIIATAAHAQVKLPVIFGDSMVLQRDVPLRIWGTANAGEQITVQLHQQQKITRAGANGKWQVMLSPEKAGGPYDLSVKGRETIVLHGILMGDLWFCSGQSNMEFPVKGWSSVYDADKVLSESSNPQIRLYTIPKKVAALPDAQSEKASWQTCSPESLPLFSAVGYFFGRRLQQDLHVPIGLINSTWGGTQIESWISHDGLAQDAHYKTVMQKAPALSMEQLMGGRKAKEEEYKRQLKLNLADLADSASWKTAGYDHSKWAAMALPGYWENQPALAKLDGVVWFRKTIVIRDEDAGQPATLQLGKIDDNDQTFLNGTLLATGSGWNVDRRYAVGAGTLKAGKNVIAIRVEDGGGGGGIWGEANELSLTVNGHRYELAGEWPYHIQEVMQHANGIGPNDYPSVLYNGMVYPFKGLNIKGAIWYQGESNAGNAYEYRYAMPLLIKDWRRFFENRNMPFYFAQLTNFIASNGNSTKGSTWAELRESQTATLSLPHTGMAVTTDIGDVNDIHPRNKKDVGERLALLALRDTYGKNVIASGPVYKAFTTTGDRIHISFSELGTGLTTRDGKATAGGFEVAGADRKFYPATATISGNEVIVHASEVAKPVAVRYAWADEVSTANLGNKEGLPARPFRTDNWPGITVQNHYDPSLK